MLSSVAQKCSAINAERLAQFGGNLLNEHELMSWQLIISKLEPSAPFEADMLSHYAETILVSTMAQLSKTFQHLLVNLQLVESKIDDALKNMVKSKAKAAVMPSIDMQSDSVSSDFYEALKNKTMCEQTGYVKAVLLGKLTLKSNLKQMAVMQQISAFEARDLSLFEQIVGDEECGGELRRLGDPQPAGAQGQATGAEPAAPAGAVRAGDAHIAPLMKLQEHSIQSKLSHMLIDQGRCAIIVFDAEPESNYHADTVCTRRQLNLAVDQLCEKATTTATDSYLNLLFGEQAGEALQELVATTIAYSESEAHYEKIDVKPGGRQMSQCLHWPSRDCDACLFNMSLLEPSAHIANLTACARIASALAPQELP